MELTIVCRIFPYLDWIWRNILHSNVGPMNIGMDLTNVMVLVVICLIGIKSRCNILFIMKM